MIQLREAHLEFLWNELSRTHLFRQRPDRLLKNAGQSDKAKEMCDRVTASQSYSEALSIVSEYVETELSPKPTPKRDRGDAR